MDQSLADVIEKRLVVLFGATTEVDGFDIMWERVEPYAIDDSCRLKKAALGFVDQGQKYDYSQSVLGVTLRMAIEFFVRANADEEIKTVVNNARAEIFNYMVQVVESDAALEEAGVWDVRAVADDIFVDRLKAMGEGVVVFDLKYRSKADDIGSTP